MRAPVRFFMLAALAMAVAVPVGAQQSDTDRTPQGRGPAKARQAAKAMKAAEGGGQAATAKPAGGEEEQKKEMAPVINEAQASEESAATGVGLTYDPEGRRDPFVSPSELMQYQDLGQCEGEGIACWLITEVNVVGVMARRTGSVALVIGPDGFGASLKAGDQLYDGEVLKVDATRGVVTFRQRVNDPTRIKPYRDIEKKLSTREGGK
jgi:Tfp pilus assembly protein PilP